MASKVHQLIGRDGHRCAWCGRGLRAAGQGKGGLFATCDHILPKSLGGSDGLWNLVLACNQCNNERGTRPAVVWMRQCLERGYQVRVEVVRAAITRSETGPAPHPVRKAGRVGVAKLGRVFSKAHPNECPACGGQMVGVSGVPRFCPACRGLALAG